MTRAGHGGLHVPWFDPVTPLGTITVADVLAAEGKAAHIAASRAWAEDLWSAWSAQHTTVRGWCDALAAQLQDYTPEVD